MYRPSYKTVSTFSYSFDRRNFDEALVLIVKIEVSRSRARGLIGALKFDFGVLNCITRVPFNSLPISEHSKLRKMIRSIVPGNFVGFVKFQNFVRSEPSSKASTLERSEVTRVSICTIQIQTMLPFLTINLVWREDRSMSSFSFRAGLSPIIDTLAPITPLCNLLVNRRAFCSGQRRKVMEHRD